MMQNISHSAQWLSSKITSMLLKMLAGITSTKAISELPASALGMAFFAVSI